jgi:hypothetical protein
MFNYLVILAILTPAILAQTNTTDPQSPLIPAGISETCKTFLWALNSDSSLTACTSSLVSLTSAYGPGQTTTHSQSSVSDTLNSFCSASASAACPESLIRGKLTEFYPACSVELVDQPNADVLRIYEVLYSINPIKTAVCAKDDSGDYCALKSHGTTPARRSSLERRDPATVPNLQAYHDSNVPFLSITGDLDNAVLCTACTRNVLSAYVQFESNIPFVPGIQNSVLLSGQAPLYTAVQSKCGENFLSGAVGAAGSLGNSLTGGAIGRAGNDLQGPMAALMGILSLAAASMI